MKELIPIINDIVQFGLHPNIAVLEKERLLEKSLVKIYNLYFDIKYKFDEEDYDDFDKQKLPSIRKNIESNFPELGFYKMIMDIHDLDNKVNNGIGDAVDDLTDIILDLLEVKWRIENNSLEDGLWYFELIFYSHTQQHIIDLLNYMKQKNS
jgi:hypothetical protein